MTNINDIRAGGAAIEFRADFSRLQRDMQAGNPVLKQIQQQFGRGSQFKETLEAIRGGGVLAGATMGNQAANDFLDVMMKVRKEVESGEKSIGRAVKETALSIPIIGSVLNFWGKVQQIIFGIGDAQAKVAEQAEAYKRAMEQVEISAKRTADAIKAIYSAGPQEPHAPGVDAEYKIREEAAKRRRASDEERAKAIKGITDPEQLLKLIKTYDAQIKSIDLAEQQALKAQALQIELGKLLSDEAKLAQYRAADAEAVKKFREAEQRAADEARQEQVDAFKRVTQFNFELADSVGETVQGFLTDLPKQADLIGSLVSSSGPARGTFNPMALLSLQSGATGDLPKILGEIKGLRTDLRSGQLGIITNA